MKYDGLQVTIPVTPSGFTMYADTGTQQETLLGCRINMANGQTRGATI